MAGGARPLPSSFFLPPCVSAPPEPAQLVHARPGSAASLPCGVAPPPRLWSSDAVLEWTRVDGWRSVLVLRGEEELVKEPAAEYVGRTALSRERALTLRDVTARDGGRYRCHVRRRGDADGASSWVWLHVAEPAAVELAVRRSPSGRPHMVCEYQGRRAEPVMSLLDGGRTPLGAESHRRTTESGRLSVTATSQGTEAADGTLSCRVELPELVVEIRSTFLDGDSALLTGSVATVAALLGLCFGAAIALFFIPVRIIEKLHALVWRRAEPEGFTLSEFGDVAQMQSSGASVETARANNVVHREGHLVSGVEASNELADRDWDALLKFREDIRSVGRSLQVDPALIAALISRQSAAGTQLSEGGSGRIDSACFGLLQINRNYHVLKGGPYSRDHLEQGVTFLVQMIKSVRMREENRAWSAEQQLKAALACYIAGQERVFREPSCERMDAITPYGDFANDVLARARRFRHRKF